MSVCSLAFLKCVIFICLFLIWTFFIFVKKTLTVSWWFFEKDFFLLWKRFDFLKLGIWSLKFGTWNSRLELLKIENLKTWDFERFETWNFEKLKLGIFDICDLKFWTWNLRFEIFATWNFGDFEFKNWAFRMWNF